MARHWYIVHTYSGFEEQVKTALLERIKKAGQEDLFGEILVPTEQVAQVEERHIAARKIRRTHKVMVGA